MIEDPTSNAATDVEPSRATRAAASRRARMALRQRATRTCGMCGSRHYREIDAAEWAACIACGIPHGGYCAPYHGATPENWDA